LLAACCLLDAVLTAFTAINATSAIFRLVLLGIGCKIRCLLSYQQCNAFCQGSSRCLVSHTGLSGGWFGGWSGDISIKYFSLFFFFVKQGNRKVCMTKNEEPLGVITGID
jgi:hypothetical protein